MMEQITGIFQLLQQTNPLKNNYHASEINHHRTPKRRLPQDSLSYLSLHRPAIKAFLHTKLKNWDNNTKTQAFPTSLQSGSSRHLKRHITPSWLLPGRPSKQQMLQLTFASCCHNRAVVITAGAINSTPDTMLAPLNFSPANNEFLTLWKSEKCLYLLLGLVEGRRGSGSGSLMFKYYCNLNDT